MATYGWRSGRSVEDFLFAEGHRFDFFQAVRLLEWLLPAASSVGEGSDPAREAVRFKSRVGFDFPATDVDEIQRANGRGHPAEMVVNFIGLAGSFGPLPAPFTEWILERVRERDTAFRDFLDIFNHRLISLMYRVRKKHRVGIDIRSPEQTHFADYCFALLGLGTGGLKGRMGLEDRSLLFYTGLLTQKPRSMPGLESFLSGYFEIAVKGRPFCGGWYPLAEDQWTAIGRSGRNRRLGQDAVLGRRVWDQNERFELVLGPLTLAQYRDFLPDGEGFERLCRLVRFYTGGDLDFDVVLVLKGSEVSESRLGEEDGPRLGWTSWLKTGSVGQAGDSHMRISTWNCVG